MKPTLGGARTRAVALGRATLAYLQGMPRITRLLYGLLGGLVVVLLVALAYISPSPKGTPLNLTDLAQLRQSQRVVSVVFRDQDHILEGVARPALDYIPGGPFHVRYPSNDAITSRMIDDLRKDKATTVRVDLQSGKALVKLLTTTLLPILILANLFALFFTARSGALGEVEAFGQIEKTGTIGGRVTFADIAGVEEAQEELQEVVDYLRNPDRYAAVGAVPPKGVLLFGPPGCGKTLLAKAVAGEAGVPFFSVAGAEFVESLVGVGAARVRDLFAKVREMAPAIVFIDELDAAGRRRGSSGGGGSEERDQTLNQMLVEMDGFDVSAGIVVIAATNRPDIIDPALLRPGRFDRHVILDRPDVERREAILRLHAAKRPVDPEVDFRTLAKQTPGFTGADLANVLNEGALLTIRNGRPIIDGPTLSEAVQRVLGGPQRRGHLLSEDERRRVAYHEAGHAIAAALLGQGDRVHRVSIVARGRGLGSTWLDREDSEAVRTEAQLRGKLAVTLAGRVCEEIELGSPSTGSADDLEAATQLAREMAGRHGLAHEEVGLQSLLNAGHAHMGVSAALAGVSEAHWARLDDAVTRLLDEAHDAARAVLETGRIEVRTITEKLLAEESLEGVGLTELLPDPLAPEEVARVLAGGTLKRPRTATRNGTGGVTAPA